MTRPGRAAASAEPARARPMPRRSRRRRPSRATGDDERSRCEIDRDLARARDLPQRFDDLLPAPAPETPRRLRDRRLAPGEPEGDARRTSPRQVEPIPADRRDLGPRQPPRAEVVRHRHSLRSEPKRDPQAAGQRDAGRHSGRDRNPGQGVRVARQELETHADDSAAEDGVQGADGDGGDRPHRDVHTHRLRHSPPAAKGA